MGRERLRQATWTVEREVEGGRQGGRKRLLEGGEGKEALAG